MYMFDDKFKDMIVSCLTEALDAEDLKSALEKSSKIITAFYPNTKLWFTKSFGKRWSFIAGAGVDSFIEPQRIEYQDGYAAFLQNFTFKQEEEKAVLTDLFRIITTIQHQ
ncbi:MAG: hypothetical protein GXW90_02960 [Tepidanaerobacter acetatoxydans]|jgi:hypothetical protein|nr:hypothetical protein [Tepidanaerobacter acetatoxydans]